MEYEQIWYSIPGFLAYEININTMQVRSNKHPNKMTHHIMKVDSGKVTIVDDYGDPKRMKVIDLFNLTFTPGEDAKPVPRATNSVWMGSMSKVNRNYDSNIDLLGGTFKETSQEKDKNQEVAFSGFLDYVKQEEPKTKPFIINPK